MPISTALMSSQSECHTSVCLLYSYWIEELMECDRESWLWCFGNVKANFLNYYVCYFLLKEEELCARSPRVLQVLYHVLDTLVSHLTLILLTWRIW